jgi:multidrug efflux pump subunit AcrA (membrane-fusion protein)
MEKIVSFVRSHWIRLVLLFIVVVAIAGITIKNKNETPDWVTATVETGTVRNVISVSGTMNAIQSANLSFPQGGIIESITVKEGDVVTQGTLLATLAHQELLAEYQDAQASLHIAQANKTELLTGLRSEEREVAHTKVAIAKDDLTRTIRVYDEKVANAYRTLLTSSLEARPDNKNNNDTAPTITGTYTCGNEGTYILEVFSSSAKSGYSYRLSGLESGTFTAYTDTPGALGTCGLSVQFASGVSYGNSKWSITIPNTESSAYITNKNAYTLALTERDNAVKSAEQNLLLAEQTERLGVADPRAEALLREDARVLQAEARVQKIVAQISEHTLRAPFTGTVSHVDPIPGETVSTEPVMTLVSKDTFEITALVPEIDVTKIAVGQKADIVFDARTEETVAATITFISPLAREIDGVSYFETKLILDAPTDWLQSGLNADIDIIIEKHEDVTRIPKRFLITEGTDPRVLVPHGKVSESVPVTQIFAGNDGYVAVSGINPGDIIVAP